MLYLCKVGYSIGNSIRIYIILYTHCRLKPPKKTITYYIIYGVHKIPSIYNLKHRKVLEYYYVNIIVHIYMRLYNIVIL